MRGLRGTTRSSIRVFPEEAFRPLPAVNDAPLRDVPTLLRNVGKDGNHAGAERSEEFFDVFISHASEDKGEVVRPLAEALQGRGLSVWYDEFELRIGDSLRQRIDHGLARSRFGVVVLSPSFFGRGWPEYELDRLVTMAVSGDQVLLPIWHGVTKQQVVDYSRLLLTDSLARRQRTQSNRSQQRLRRLSKVLRKAARSAGNGRGQTTLFSRLAPKGLQGIRQVTTAQRQSYRWISRSSASAKYTVAGIVKRYQTGSLALGFRS